MEDIDHLSLREIGKRLRAGATSAMELAEGALSRVRFGAYREVDEAKTLAQAAAADAAFSAGRDLGPLQGIPISVKDLYGVPGYGTWAGSPARLPARFETAGPVVRAALDQLATVVGKTHTVEFAFGGVGTNPHHPTPINPWDSLDHRAPGGSSSGAGVSLAEGSALLAFGTDTAGSVRIPASWTGNAALKTTWRRWSTEGIVPLSPSLDTAGLLARTVDDLALAFEVIDGGPRILQPPISSLRLGRCDELLFDGCSPGVVEAIEQALSELAGAGAEVVSSELPEALEAFDLLKQGGPVAAELYHFLSTEIPERLESLDPNVRTRIGGAAQLTAVEYLQRLKRMRALSARADERLSSVDLLVSPTVANTPPRLADIDSPGRYGPQNLLCLRNTSVVSYLGLCAVTIPVGTDRAGMPVGLQLIGRSSEDRHLLAWASSCEAVLGTGRDRLGRPPRVEAGDGEAD